MDLKTVVKNDIFRSERGSGFGDRAAQPHQAFLGVPPPGTQLINPFNKMGKVKILTKNADLFLYNPNKGSAQPVSAQTSVPEVPSSVPNVTSNRCFDIYSFRVALNRFISVYSLNGVLMKRG